MSTYPLGSGNSNTSLNKGTTNQSPPLAGRSTISIIFQMPNVGLRILKSLHALLRLNHKRLGSERFLMYK